MLFAQEQLGSIRGTVVSEEGEPLPFAKVILYTNKRDSLNRQFVAGVHTDFDGMFYMKYLNPGIYVLEIEDETMLLQPMRLEGIEVKPNQISVLGELEMSNKEMEIIGCDFGTPYWEIEFLQQVPFGNATIIEKEDLRRP